MVALLALMAVVAGACTSSSSQAGDDGAPRATAEPRATATPNVAAAADTLRPTRPGTLEVDASPRATTVQWTASTDDVGVAGYRVYRDGELVSDQTSTRYVDDAIGEGAAAAYEVEAYDEAGNVSRRANEFVQIDETIATELIAAGSEWTFTTEPQPAEWMTAGFDTTGWDEARAQIGYGDGDETTVLEGQPRTVYLRTEFRADDVDELSHLALDLTLDDAIVVWINGVAVHRENINEEEIGHHTPARIERSAPREDTPVRRLIMADALQDGRNLMAVQVHQSPRSVDMSFDLTLSGWVQLEEPDDEIRPLPEPPAWIPFDARAVAEPGEVIGVDADFELPGDTLVGIDTTWQYVSENVDIGTRWDEGELSDAFDAEGIGEFGFGDDDETTVIDSTPTSIDPNQHRVTAYFATTFTTRRPDDIDLLHLVYVVDDGAIFYLNGTEVLRVGMDDRSRGFWARASETASGPFERVRNYRTLDVADVLVTGVNELRVEVHNIGPWSDDMSFDLLISGGGRG